MSDSDVLLKGFDKARDKFLEMVDAGDDSAVHGAFSAVREALAASFMDQKEAEQALGSLGKPRNNELFSEVGKLTRHLHSSLQDFKTQLSPRLGQLASNGVPQAADQLQSVITMTDEAAHKVLGLVESQSAEISSQKEMLSKGDLEETKEKLIEANGKIANLNTEILMAQEFQDLSGQILKKVISLIADVEDSLVDLVKMFGLPASEKPVEEPELKGPDTSGQGCDQEDVNDLLSSLGF